MKNTAQTEDTKSKIVEVKISNPQQKMNKAREARTAISKAFDTLMNQGQLPATLEERVKLMGYFLERKKTFDRTAAEVKEQDVRFQRAWSLLSNFSSHVPAVASPVREPLPERVQKLLQERGALSGAEIARTLNVSGPNIYALLRRRSDIFEKAPEGIRLKQ